MTALKFTYALISTLFVGGLTTTPYKTPTPATESRIVLTAPNQTGLVSGTTRIPLREWVPVGSVWYNARVVNGRLVSGVLLSAPGGSVCRSALTPQQLTGAWTGTRESGTYVVLPC
jgi:hypothetical protein